MASSHVTCCENKWRSQNENLGILISNNNNNNVCELDVDPKKQKYSFNCFCVFKENLKQTESLRKRSKSESYRHFSLIKNDLTCCQNRNRIRTYSSNRSMHDKGLNVCMMPENMQEFLLDGYKTKPDINWQLDTDGKVLSTSEVNGHDFVPQNSVPLAVAKNNVTFEYTNGRGSANEKFDVGGHRESIIGVKRTRDKSPNYDNNYENNNSKDGIPLKMQPKSVPDTEYFVDCTNDDVRLLKHPCKENLPVSGEKTSALDFESHFQSNDRFNASQLDHCCNNAILFNSEFLDQKNTNSYSDLNSESDLCSSRTESQNYELIGGNSDFKSSDLSHDVCSRLKQNKNLQMESFIEISAAVENANRDCTEENDEECDCSKHLHRDTLMIDNANTDQNSIHSGLRLSLFPNVPPYVKFSTYDVKGEPFPVHIHRLLRWKLSKITPMVVRKVVTNSGYRLLKKSTYWGGTWGKHTRSVGFKTLFDYQKMNHFPGTFQIGRKDRLWKSMQKLMSKFGKQKFDLMPTTYILPRDKKLLRTVWKKNGNKEPWIIKPPASARGTGIKVVHKWCQIPENAPVIVQKYISNPFLINDTKFDLRLYVLITSVNPLRIYLYDNGLVRFASVKYSTELSTLGDRYMHLTNYSINKLSSKYKQNEDAHACQGHKWTLKTLWNYMDKELNIDVENLWQRLTDLIIKTVISGEQSITQLSNANLGSRYNSYELLGVDVLLDTDLKPWLLEVNISPSLHSASPLDLAVKAPMVYDLMNIVGFQIPCSKKFTEEQLLKDLSFYSNKCLCYDNRLYTRSLSTAEKCKHQHFSGKPRQEYLESILEDLTPDDVRHLIQYEDELTQLGSFQKIFPTFSSHEYLQYFESPRYHNLLFDAWETKYHSERDEGIRLLYEKCAENVHLNVPKVSTNSTKDKKNGNTNESTGLIPL